MADSPCENLVNRPDTNSEDLDLIETGNTNGRIPTSTPTSVATAKTEYEDVEIYVPSYETASVNTNINRNRNDDITSSGPSLRNAPSGLSKVPPKNKPAIMEFMDMGNESNPTSPSAVATTTKISNDDTEITVPSLQLTKENINKSLTEANDVPSGLNQTPRKTGTVLTTEAEVRAMSAEVEGESVPPAAPMASLPAMVPLRGLQKNKHKKSEATGARYTTRSSPNLQDVGGSTNGNALSGSSEKAVPAPNQRQDTPKGIQRGLRRIAEERQAKLEARNTKTVNPSTTSKEGPAIPPLRGLAKNREQKQNHDTNPPTNHAHGRGLRKNAPPQRESGNEGSGLEDLKPSYLPYLNESPENQEDAPQEPVEEPVPTPPPGLSSLATGQPTLRTPSIPSPPTSSNFGLVVARPVQEDTASLMEAQEVDPEDLQRQQSRHTKGQECKVVGCAVLAICCIVLTLMLGLTLGKKDEKTLSPPNMSATPSSAPTGALDLLLQDLPSYTLNSLKNYSSPQWKARVWLENHPDLSGMKEWRKKQLFAVAAFFYAMSGPNWREAIRDDWLQYSDECYWWSAEFGRFSFLDGKYDERNTPAYNRAPCNEHDEFQSIYLRSLELASFKPSIPAEITFLTSFSILALPSNDVSASTADFLPTHLYQMSNLTVLNLESNSLTGPVPSELGMLASLSLLDLDDNTLTGTIPSQVGKLSSPSLLNLRGNSLTGPIPSELGLLTSLTGLSLEYNSLTGPIPSELGMLTALTRLNLEANSLTGPVASQLGTLASLSELDLRFNSLTGLIPSQLGLLTSLSKLQLKYNSLTGMIPIEVIALLPQFSSYSFGSLTGSIPSELGLVTSASRLYLAFNSLTGSIPSELGLLTSLSVLHLEGNSLTGPIPSELGLMTSLGYLYLYSNSLTGSMPSELGNLASLSEINLTHNSLTGTIPIEVIALLAHLYSYGFDRENYPLYIPSEIGLLASSIEELDMSGMSLIGSIPSDLSLLTSLKGLILNDNALTGPVPTEFGLMTSLAELDLNSNNLAGPIPTELGLLSNMTGLWLYANALSGPIPSQIGLLTSLTHLHLAHN